MRYGTEVDVTLLKTRGQGYAVDLALARRCATEEAARQEVFRHHADAIFRLAWRLVSNRTDAEDVLQEVFIQVFASISTYRGEASLRSWLHRVTVRTAGRYRRRVRRRRDRLSVVREPGNEELATGDLRRIVESREALRRLWSLLDHVADGRRVVFVLHEVEGYTLPEVAALLDISVTAAKKRVWRARRDIEKLARDDAVLRELFPDVSRSADLRGPKDRSCSEDEEKND